MGNFFRSVLGAAAALLQSKSVTATTSQQTVLPDNGYDGLSEVTVNPQSHSGTVTISSKYETGNGYDMGANHSKRYVKTSGLMKTPTATKSITANGTGIDVKDYAKVDVSVAAATPSLAASNKHVGTISSSVYIGSAGTYVVFAASQNNNENFSYFSNVSFSNGTLTSLGTNYVQGDGWTLRGYCWRLSANGAGTLSYSCRFLGTIWVVKTG